MGSGGAVVAAGPQAASTNANKDNQAKPFFDMLLPPQYFVAIKLPTNISKRSEQR
jgi:hypothetical protein